MKNKRPGKVQLLKKAKLRREAKTFLNKIKNNNILDIAKVLAKKLEPQLLKSLLTDEDEDCRRCFDEWERSLRRNGLYKLPIYDKQSNEQELVKVQDLLNLLSNDQRKGLVSTLLLHKQYRKCQELMKNESEEAQNYFMKLAGSLQAQEGEIRLFDPESDYGKLHDAPGVSGDADDLRDWRPSVDKRIFDEYKGTTNILILGETGVGKSTFINGLANYLKFYNFHEAISRENRENIEIPIRVHFKERNAENNEIIVDCLPSDKNDNENEKIGASGTISPKSYAITWGSGRNRKMIRIIDTPGIGDTQGIEQDKVNFDKIMEHLTYHKYLHAILILLKPTESVMTTAFKYCLNELFTRLHFSATKNILFCFTNTRATMYKPGDSLENLKKYLDHLKTERSIDIPLNQSNLFCFDNESFRALCAVREGVNYTPEVIKTFENSWQWTVQEIIRMFGAILTLPKHAVDTTVNLNYIRTIIKSFAEPLAKIVQKRLKKAKEIEDEINKIDLSQKEVDKLSSKLFKKEVDQQENHLVVTQIYRRTNELKAPMTVCTSNTCVEVIKIEKEGEPPEQFVNYKICHNVCNISKITTESWPNEVIKECELFHRPDGLCKKCKCSWDTHMQQKSMNMHVVRKVEDEKIKDKVKQLKNELAEKEINLEKLKKKKYNLYHDAQCIREDCAVLAAYINKSAILEKNNEYQRYIEELIAAAEKKDNEAWQVEVLKAHRDKYLCEVEFYNDHGYAKVSTSAELYSLIDDLKLAYPEVLKNVEHANEFQDTTVSLQLQGGWFENALR